MPEASKVKVLIIFLTLKAKLNIEEGYALTVNKSESDSIYSPSADKFHNYTISKDPECNAEIPKFPKFTWKSRNQIYIETKRSSTEHAKSQKLSNFSIVPFRGNIKPLLLCAGESNVYKLH